MTGVLAPLTTAAMRGQAMMNQAATVEYITNNSSNPNSTIQLPKNPCVSGSALDDPTLRTFSFLVNVVFVGLLSLGGLICNILSIMTLQKDRHKLSMSILLQGLAGSDILFLVYSFIYTTLRSVFPYNGQLRSVYNASPYIVAYVLPFGWISQTATIWIVMLVAIDRYVAVCHPFRSSRWCTIKKARYAVVIAFVAAFVFNFPRFFYYHHQAFDIRHNHSSSTFVAHIHMHSDFWTRYRLVYHIFMTMVFLYIIPLPVLMTLNAKLIHEIAQAKKRQLQLTGTKSEKDTIKVTINLIVIVTVFVICETPDFIASIIALEYFCLSKTFLEYFLCVKEFLLVLNASTNFFIYCLFYTKFRMLLKHMLCSFLTSEEYPFTETERNGQKGSKVLLSEMDPQETQRKSGSPYLIHNISNRLLNHTSTL